MAGPAQEQALPLLALANNHGDLAVKLSSLKQVKDILLSAEPSHAAELFPYMVELQSSPETLVRKFLLEVIDEIGAKSMEHLSILLPILLMFLKDNNSMVAKQSIITGTKFFCSVLEDLPLQFQRRGKVERWLEELWMWMVKYKDAVFSIIFEAGSVGPKLLAIKFLETYILHFTQDTNDSEKVVPEVTTRHGRAFNISMLVDCHPVLDLPALVSDATRYFGILLDLLRSAGNLPGSLTISVVNSLALIARKRPMYYSSVLLALLNFNVNSETVKGRHTLSIHCSLKTVFLGFMRCTHPVIVESRERLLKALRAMNAGDAADQVIRQVDKIKRSNERDSWDLRLSKDDQQSDQLPILGDVMSKRLTPMENEDSNNTNDVTYKRLRYGGPHGVTDSRLDVNDAGQDHINGISPKVPLLDQVPTPLEQMIAMIGALIAEGERGVESLEILTSNIHPDLLADIVITNMKHFPRNPPPFSPTTFGNLPLNCRSDSPSLSQGVASNGSMSMQILGLAAQLPVSSLGMTSLPSSDMPTSSNLPSDSKCDPRRDPRRLDPRRMVAPFEVLPPSFVDDNTSDIQCHALQPDFDDSSSLSETPALPYLHSSECVSVSPMPKSATDLNLLECSVKLEAGQSTPKVEVQDMEAKEIITDSKGNAALYTPLSTLSKVEDTVAQTSLNAIMLDEAYSPSSQEMDELSPPISNLEASEVVFEQLPVLPPYMELNEDHQRTVIKLALERIIDACQNIQRTDFTQTQMALLARLFAQIDASSDVVMMMQKRIVTDYQEQKGHELVMHVLYHIRTLMLSDSSQNSSSAATLYENFLLDVAKSLLDAFPATDKSFSRLLGEVPYLPESVLRLLNDLCSRSHSGVDGRDGDRVTQGLGVVWSLILGRPLNREACLGIALKCAVHSMDDVRAKAIRLVANKLYVMSNVAENIEEFATNMFLSAVEQRVSETGILQSVSHKQRIGQVGSQETSVSGSQISDPGVSENDTIKVAEESTSDSAISFSQAQRLVSLFFALCAKRPSLLQLVFNNYARASKAVKKAVHRHTPVLIRALGSSYSELLQIISDPPQGSEQLLTQVLHVLSEGKTPPDLVAAVKRLYETKLKDASILIPILSSFSRDEVLPIFPRLVNLPLDKFQTALAHILQGSSHTGPALTPAEVLVAIHDIIPERDGLPLKKITDACSACFEQRTVFTQQVLANALNQMVDQIPLPLLFMRTVIQAIDAFPKLVHFVMEILSKLVNKQVWRMPKLWVGFLKCISQTQPHSFSVLLQLPSPQLENALNKYSNLRSPLLAFVNQSNVRSSVPSLQNGFNNGFLHHVLDFMLDLRRSTLVLLGIAT